MQLADQLYQMMTKKFGNVLRVWSEYGSFLMRRGKMDAARNLLQRSFKSLPSKQDRESPSNVVQLTTIINWCTCVYLTSYYTNQTKLVTCRA